MASRPWFAVFKWLPIAVGETSWSRSFCSTLSCGKIRQGPTREWISRAGELYRKKLVNIADHSDCSEIEVANQALALALAAHEHPDADPRLSQRRSHVGYYLLAEGMGLLERRVGFHPPLLQRLHGFVGASGRTLSAGHRCIDAGDNDSGGAPADGSWKFFGAYFSGDTRDVLPSSQSALQIMNFLVTFICPRKFCPSSIIPRGFPATPRRWWSCQPFC